MSLFALADRSVQERTLAPAPPGPPAPPKLRDGEAAPDPPGSVTKALKALIDFIPTETIALFWLAVPASAAIWEKWHGVKPETATCLDWWVFGVLLALTPVLLLLAFLSGLASAGKPWPGLKSLPWWKAFASLIAFPA